jgi:glycine dehydrogenase
VPVEDAHPRGEFVARHIGPSPTERDAMLATLGYADLEELVDAAVPSSLRSTAVLAVPPPAPEHQVAAELRDMAARNRPAVPMLGLGYHGTVTPAVLRRNVLEDPAWYTAYTPYQPEISQGRLEALLNFQTVVADLTGLPTANASLLDEGTAVAEAMALMRRAGHSRSHRLLVDVDTLPQTLAVVRTRAASIGVAVETFDVSQGMPDGEAFGVVLSLPGCSGELRDLAPLIAAAHERGALVTAAVDLLALTLITPPGEVGADVVVGSSQRFGVPLFFGGPHAGFMSVRAGLERHLPGRLVGVSIDAVGTMAYRLALQTREQHIRRDKATSNICTAQVLLAVMAGFYAVYHGADGLRSIAARVHRYAVVLADGARAAGLAVEHRHFFDTVVIEVEDAALTVKRARDSGIWIRQIDERRIAASTSELTTHDHVRRVLAACDGSANDASDCAGRGSRALEDVVDAIPDHLRRTSSFLTHPVFTSHRSETSMLRYMRRLADRDFALDRGMIPLGSCTMKLNGTTEMEAVSLPGFAEIHPFAPAEDVAGYLELIAQLESWLAEVTGYAAVSVQPNAGSQGELAGLQAIRDYHRSRGDDTRDVCLIPSSAHGTNAASAVLAGMRVVVVGSCPDGTVDVADLARKCAEHRDALAAVMVTYPSTHGVYEEGISKVCRLVHEHGGQVYVDGANLNALLGVAAPGKFGGDVSHLNLHKTFCIPHGGGGPGVGPVAVAEHLRPFLPTHPLHPDPERRGERATISAAPFGSAGILPIPWAYIRLMGGAGLLSATQHAILSANYLAKRLSEHYPILYTGAGGLVAHECIVDLRPLTASTGVTVDDVGKRLIDHGFHAPTTSFPVAGTLMIEPTESEDLGELDRFVDAMVSIRAEIQEIADGAVAVAESPLRHAPHTTASLVGPWSRSYDRGAGAFPGGHVVDKYWPPVARVQQAHGDRNLMCSCPDPTAFEG